MEVKIGQVWRRKKCGGRYRIADVRYKNFLRDVRLVPLDKGGRSSWKYDRNVPIDMELVAEGIECTHPGK